MRSLRNFFFPGASATAKRTATFAKETDFGVFDLINSYESEEAGLRIVERSVLDVEGASDVSVPGFTRSVINLSAAGDIEPSIKSIRRAFDPDNLVLTKSSGEYHSLKLPESGKCREVTQFFSKHGVTNPLVTELMCGDKNAEQILRDAGHVVSRTPKF